MMSVPSIDMVATGMNINRLRRQAGITVQDIREVMGFSTPQAIYKWLRGDALPTLDNFVILSAILGTPIDAIIVLDAGDNRDVNNLTA